MTDELESLKKRVAELEKQANEEKKAPLCSHTLYYATCKNCKGRGFNWHDISNPSSYDPDGFIASSATCHHCRGSGVVGDEYCPFGCLPHMYRHRMHRR